MWKGQKGIGQVLADALEAEKNRQANTPSRSNSARIVLEEIGVVLAVTLASALAVHILLASLPIGWIP